jgi:hypothetical protein
MPGQSSPTRPGQRQLRTRILAYPAQAILSTLMALAVVVLERRIRTALRSGAASDQRASGQAGPGQRDGLGLDQGQGAQRRGSAR